MESGVTGNKYPERTTVHIGINWFLTLAAAVVQMAAMTSSFQILKPATCAAKAAAASTPVAAPIFVQKATFQVRQTHNSPVPETTDLIEITSSCNILSRKDWQSRPNLFAWYTLLSGTALFAPSQKVQRSSRISSFGAILFCLLC